MKLDPALGALSKKPNCFTCQHVQFNSSKDGVFTVCGVADEIIDSEVLAARDCGAYEEDLSA